MIRYRTGGFLNFFQNLAQMNGSVFHRALVVALPNSILTALFVHFRWESMHFSNDNSILTNFAVWGGFVSLLSFLVVFRANMANTRFEHGAVATHSMGAHWFHACSSLMAFINKSSVAHSKVLKFQNMIIRLFSILHAVALAEIEIEGARNEDPRGSDRVRAFFMEVIDCDSIDDESLICLQHSNARVEIVFQWIEQYIVKRLDDGVLDVPAPLITRAFAELEAGMTDFNVAMEISVIPFPFPFAQTCNTALVFHWLISPFVLSSFVQYWWWGAVFAFVQVFTLWALVFISIELSEPFGTDTNDLEGTCMQKDMNKKLRALVTAAIVPPPSFKDEDYNLCEEEKETFCTKLMKKMDLPSTLSEAWARVHRIHPDELDIWHRMSERDALVEFENTGTPVLPSGRPSNFIIASLARQRTPKEDMPPSVRRALDTVRINMDRDLQETCTLHGSPSRQLTLTQQLTRLDESSNVPEIVDLDSKPSTKVVGVGKTQSMDQSNQMVSSCSKGSCRNTL